MRTGRAAGLLAGLIAGLAISAAASDASAQSLARRYDFLRLQQRAVDAVSDVLESEGGSCSAQFDTLHEVYKDPRFGVIEAPVRRTALFALMLCAEGRDLPLAAEASRQLEPLAEEPLEITAIRSVQISEALQRGDKAGAARIFLDLVRLQPKTVAAWAPEMVSPFTDYIDGDPDLSLKLAETIARLDWTEPASRKFARNTWALSYGWQLADHGHLKEAGEAVAEADDLYVLMIVAGDRRYQSVWEAFAADGGFDWTKTAEAWLLRSREEAAAAPDQLRPLDDCIDALRALGRFEEAIQIGEAAQARLQDGEAFSDATFEKTDTLISLGQAYFETGRYEAAEAVFVAAVGDDPDDLAIDARIAWAGRLLDLGRPTDVLKMLAPIGDHDLTPYGRLWVTSQQACAQASLDPAAATALLTALEAGKDENPAAYSQALLCLNRIDEAATLLAGRLAQPQNRAGALDPYWVTRAPPVVAPWAREYERRRQEMLARPVALAALATYGRKVEAPLTGDYWGGF